MLRILSKGIKIRIYNNSKAQALFRDSDICHPVRKSVFQNIRKQFIEKQSHGCDCIDIKIYIFPR